MAKRQLLIGTGNRDKGKEIETILRGLPLQIVYASDFPDLFPPEEVGASYVEIARQKALYYYERTQIPCVADDSGLEVDALEGRPGIWSAHYAGPTATYRDNNEKLLRELEGIPWHERTARYRCCAVFVSAPDHCVHEEGIVEGHISVAPFGENGFGYDPLFVPEGYGKTFAEMAEKIKHALSHRGNAFRRLRKHIEQWLSNG